MNHLTRTGSRCRWQPELFLLHLVHLTDEHDSVEHRHTEEGDEAHTCRNTERHSAEPKCPHTADGSQRNRREDEKRLTHILHRGIEQQQDDDQRYRNHHHQSAAGTLQILKLTTIIIIVAFREFQLFVENLLDILHRALHITPLHIEAHVDASGTILMRHLCRSRRIIDIRYLRKRNIRAILQRNTQQFKLLYIALRRIHAKHDIKFPVALVDGTSHGTGKGSLQNTADIIHADAVSRHLLVVVSYLDLRQAGYFFYKDATHARHTFYHLLHLSCLLGKHIEIVTENLDSHILLDTRKQLVVAHLDRLGNLCLQTRNGAEGFLHFLHQFGSRLGRGPFCLRLQGYHDVGTFHRHRVGRNFSASDAAHHLLDFRIFLLEQFFCLATALHHLRERRSLRHTHFHSEVTFFQTRDKLASQILEAHHADAEQSYGTRDDIPVAGKHPIENRSIPALQLLYHLIRESLSVVHLAAQQERTCHRHIGERQDEGTEDGKEHGERHRTEHLSLDAHQGHQRNVYNHDDDFAEGCTLADAGSREVNLLVHLLLGQGERNRISFLLALGKIGSTHLGLREMTCINMCNHRLDDDDGGIDNHTEVDGTQ